MTGLTKISVSVIFLFLSLSLLAGCGSSTKEAGPEAEAGIAHIGFTECYNCHADAKNPASFPVAFGDSNLGPGKEGWLNGPHGNNESYNTTTHQKYDIYPDNTGFPFYAFFSDSTCATCHDPLGDGKRISKFFIATGVDKLGRVDRPVIGCESCHGPGGNHYGLGPMPYPKPDFNRCGQCHNNTFPANHLPFHPEGDNILENYKASGHAKSINSHTYVSGSTTDVRARCSRCHTDEGAKRYITAVSGTADYNTIKSILDPLPNILNASNVQCRTCHDGHNTLRLLGEKDTTLPLTWSAEFKTCTTCHQLLKADGTLQDRGYHTPYDKSGTQVNPFGSIEEIIADTHYDDPSTPQCAGGNCATGDFVAGTGGIEGYIVNPSGNHNGLPGNQNQGICSDCHNPHNSDLSIHKQWARSAHGGHILEKKEGATNVYTASVTRDDAPGWVYYNWKRSGRAACQRCHTSTGFRNFANSPSTYNPANNFFIATQGQSELLYCWACHTDNVGGLRDPGQLTFVYTNNATVTYPDVEGSNICMACHTGRETGDSIKNDPDADGIRSFINSHYLAAGGTVFTTTGYEYTGRNYNNVTFYAHDKIGLPAAPGTGTNGPCVGCHMISDNSHLFMPVEKDESTDTITSITSKICIKCHTGNFALTPAKLNQEKHEYEAALEVLKAALASKGIFFRNAFPYFFVDTNGNGILEPTETIAYTNWAGPYGFTYWKDTMGAAFNLNLLIHDPGGFAHNRFYVKALIWDSIDFIDNGNLDHSVPSTITALTADPDNLDTTIDSATAAAASAYLGNSRPGDPNRP
ncbi:MAG: C-type polyheme cytochrome OmcB [Thermodesulfovibrionales bacterium]|nr:C-type polyheme cytochrome OmcB [Thermodesulfovibrionales bacterium]